MAHGRPAPPEQTDPTAAQLANWPAGMVAYVGLGGNLWGLAILQRPQGQSPTWAVQTPETGRWDYVILPVDGTAVLFTAGGWMHPRIRTRGGQVTPEPR